MRSRFALSTARSSAKLDTVLPWDIEMAIEDAENEDDAEDPDAEDTDAEDADAARK